MKLNTILLAGATMLAASSASAQTFTGQTLRVYTVYPNITSDTSYQDIVTPGSTDFFGLHDITVGGNSILITNTLNALRTSYSQSAFNGYRFSDVNGTIPDFTGVTIGAATNEPGLDASRITYDANNIYLNLQSLSSDTTYTIQLNVNSTANPSAPAVPEPATWAMMVLGFGMVGFGLRSRRKVSTKVSFA